MTEKRLQSPVVIADVRSSAPNMTINRPPETHLDADQPAEGFLLLMSPGVCLHLQLRADVRHHHPPSSGTASWDPGSPWVGFYQFRPVQNVKFSRSSQHPPAGLYSLIAASPSCWPIGCPQSAYLGWCSWSPTRRPVHRGDRGSHQPAVRLHW